MAASARSTPANLRITATRSSGRRGQTCGLARVYLVLVEPLLPEVHDVGPSEPLLEEVDGEEPRQALPVPAVRLQELLVVLPRLVPVGEERGREVDALPVPGLGHHVQLGADLLRVHELRAVRI